ncbi:MAG: flavin reductase family protein [Alphaproteobacteria bacterium]|nr:flavin reductase family protein [Alphaproteobacteria bacterium]
MRDPAADYFYAPETGHGLEHDPMKAIIAPRPIGWMSTMDAEGRVNLAPFSYFNAFCSRPPILGFASEQISDTLQNILETGEFVFNLVTEELAEAMNATALAAPRGVNEMALAGLAPAQCRAVRAPRVAASPVAMECKVLSVQTLRDLSGAETASHLVLGQVVGVHIDPDYLREGRFDTAAARPLARCGYLSDYAVVREMFKMRRPR